MGSKGGIGLNSEKWKIPTSREISLFIIAFLWYLCFHTSIQNLLACVAAAPHLDYRKDWHMHITFEPDTNVIVYTLDRIISYARRTQQIIVAQSVWWSASIIGLWPGLISHIDNLQIRSKVIQEVNVIQDTASIESEVSKLSQQDMVLKECKEFLCSSKWLCDLAPLKATGLTKMGHINPLRATKKALQSSKTL
jgi:hypothetical protein